MAYAKKATDEQILESYERTGSIWETGKEFGMCGQSVHERLVNLGAINAHYSTREDKDRLIRDYAVYRDAGKLQQLADDMGFTKTSLCRIARSLNLTDKHCKRTYVAVWKNLPEEVCRPIFDDMRKSRKTLKEFCASRGYGMSAFTRRMQELFPSEWAAEVEKRQARNGMYKRGRDFEYRVKRELESNGFNVIRSYGSKGPADLTATKSGSIVYIQCKLRGTMQVDEWNKFLDYCNAGGGLPILARRSDDGSSIDYFRLVGKKDGTKRPQPYEKTTIEEFSGGVENGKR